MCQREREREREREKERERDRERSREREREGGRERDHVQILNKQLSLTSFTTFVTENKQGNKKETKNKHSQNFQNSSPCKRMQS